MVAAVKIRLLLADDELDAWRAAGAVIIPERKRVLEGHLGRFGWSFITWRSRETL